MNRVIVYLLALLLTPVISDAAEAAVGSAALPDSRTCPDRRKVRNICSTISDKTKDSNPLSPSHQYLFQRQILEAACVDVAVDSREQIAKKVQVAWKALEDDLVCSGVQFDVQGGSIIKFAATKIFDVFIAQVVLWGVELNRVDPTDQRTALDYVKYKIEQNRNDPVAAQKFQSYYNRLRLAGAKHASEL